eukprot:13016224-Ditylum_brightwellii.AAC.1
MARRKDGNAQKSMNALKRIQDIWDKLPQPIPIQGGGTIKTCSFYNTVNRVDLYLKTDGRPLDANIDLWNGPSHAPQKMSIHVEDGSIRPFHCVVQTPGTGNSIAIQNTANMEFPLSACITAELDESGDSSSSNRGNSNNNPAKKLSNNGIRKIIQG